MQHLELVEALTELSETTIRYVILLLVGVQDRERIFRAFRYLKTVKFSTILLPG